VDGGIRKVESREHQRTSCEHAFLGTLREQDAAYRESVFSVNVTGRVSSRLDSDDRMGTLCRAEGQGDRMHSFGASAPLKDLLRSLAFCRERGGRRKKFWESERSMKLVIGSDHAGFQLKVNNWRFVAFARS